jgi:hypothetical protein
VTSGDGRFIREVRVYIERVEEFGGRLIRRERISDAFLQLSTDEMKSSREGLVVDVVVVVDEEVEKEERGKVGGRGIIFSLCTRLMFLMLYLSLLYVCVL